MRKKDAVLVPFIGVTGVIILLSISGLLGMFLWTYTINSWLVFAGKEPLVVWWQGFLLGYVPWVGQFSIPAAIITWIAMLFLM